MQQIIEKLKTLENLKLHSTATPIELEQLRKTLTFDVPQELLQLLQLFNGDTEDFLLHEPVGLLSVDEIIRKYLRLCNLAKDELDVLVLSAECDKRVKSYLWSKKWIPFGDMNGDVEYAIDLDPTELGTVGQIILVDWECGTNLYCASSLTVFLEKIYELQLRGGYGDDKLGYCFDNLSD